MEEAPVPSPVSHSWPEEEDYFGLMKGKRPGKHKTTGCLPGELRYLHGHPKVSAHNFQFVP